MIYLALLTFSHHKARASELMADHNAWIARGLADGVFLVVGSLAPARGGAVLAHGVTRAELDARLALDPFVAHGVVTVEILEIAPAKADPHLAFLLAPPAR